MDTTKQIQKQLTLMLVIFVVVTLGGMIYTIYDQYNDYKDIKNSKAKIVAIQKQTKLLHELQLERDLSSLYLSTGDSKDYHKLSNQRKKINTDIPILDGLRKSIDNQDIWSELSTKIYTEKINSIILRDILLSDFKINDDKLSNIKNQYIYLVAYKEYTGAIRAILSSAFAINEFTEDNKLLFLSILAKYKESYQRYIRLKGKGYIIQDNDLKDKIEAIIEIATNKNRDFNLDHNEWFKLSSLYIDSLQQEEEALSNDLTILLDNKIKNILLYTIILFVLFIIILAILIWYFRSISISILNISKQIEIDKNELASTLAVIDENLIYSETNLQGKITKATKRFQEISGYSNEELIGKSHNIVRDPSVPKDVFENMWDTIKNHQAWEGVVSNKAKNGDIYILKARVFPKYDINGEKIGYMSVRIDITEQEQLKQAAIKNTKFIAMGEMIGMIAHQWRQPLTSIGALMGKLSIKRDFGQLDDTTWSESVDKHKRLVKYMDKTISDFLNFYKESNNQTTVNTRKIISDTYTIIEASFESHNMIFNINDSYNQNIKLDVNKFEQVLINLYKNGLDQLISQNISNGKVDVVCYSKDDNIIFEVCDNGGGIPEGIIDDIFNPYFSTKSKNGTGLGLYMVKIIIEDQLEGNIEVFNRDAGAVFKITLPH